MTDGSDNIFDTSVPLVSHLTYNEWHAFLNGLGVGFVGFPDKRDVAGVDRHYWRAGFALGWTVKVLVILYVGTLVIT